MKKIKNFYNQYKRCQTQKIVVIEWKSVTVSFFRTFSHNKWKTMCNFRNTPISRHVKSTLTFNFVDRSSLRKSDSLFNTFVVLIIHIVSMQADIKARYHFVISLPLTLFWWAAAVVLTISKPWKADRNPLDNTEWFSLFPDWTAKFSPLISLIIKISIRNTFNACTADSYSYF